MYNMQKRYNTSTKVILKDFQNNSFLPSIHDIDTGKARGYSRALFVSSILNKVSTYAGKGEEVTFLGFGKFEVAERAARTGRNPQTGEEMTIEAKKVVKFKPGKGLSEAVNKQ